MFDNMTPNLSRPDKVSTLRVTETLAHSDDFSFQYEFTVAEKGQTFSSKCVTRSLKRCLV